MLIRVKIKVENKFAPLDTYRSNKYLYMYNRDKSILYFYTKKISDFFHVGIHYITLKKHLKKGTYYLGKYKFSKEFVPSAKYKKISLLELDLKLKRDREEKFTRKG